MNKMKAWQGSYGVSDLDGIISPAYFVFELVGVSGEFFHRSIRSSAYVPFFTQASDGVRVGQWDLNIARMKEIPIFFPNHEEQIETSRMVDGQVERVIASTRVNDQEIAFLQEYRTRLIADVVTGKLDIREFARTLPADIAEEAAELADSELGDQDFSDADDELAVEFAGEPA